MTFEARIISTRCWVSRTLALAGCTLLASCKCDEPYKPKNATKPPPESEAPSHPAEKAQAYEKTEEVLESLSKSMSPIPQFEDPADFVKHCLVAEREKGLDYVMELYAEEVAFFGTDCLAPSVRAHLADYREKWPVRSEKISSIVFTTQTDENRWDVSFNTSFKYTASGRKDWMNGTKFHEYTVIQKGRRYYVTGRTGEYRHTIGPKGESFPAEDLRDSTASSAELRLKAKMSQFPRVTKAVRLLDKVREAEGERNIEGVMAAYAPKVTVFEEKMSKEDLYQKKIGSYMLWPKFEETRTSDFAGSPFGKNFVRITFESTFKKSNELEGSWESGVMKHVYIFSEIDGKMLIVEQSGEVTKRKTSD